MRSANQFPVQQKGIYRNLPTFDPSITGLTAIVPGATGISGFNTIRCLLESPEKWSKVYALSRSPPSDQLLDLLDPSQRERLHHVPVDLLSSATCIFMFLYPNPVPCEVRRRPCHAHWLAFRSANHSPISILSGL